MLKLENPIDRVPWWATWGHKESDTRVRGYTRTVHVAGQHGQQVSEKDSFFFAGTNPIQQVLALNKILCASVLVLTHYSL